MARFLLSTGALLALLIALGFQQAQRLQGKWQFSVDQQLTGFSTGSSSLAAKIDSSPVYGPSDRGAGLVLNSAEDCLVIAESLTELASALPAAKLSVSAWVAVERPQRWGGIVSCIQDNGGLEKGFVLGYEDELFSFGLSTTGANDGDGKLTYLRGVKPMVPGRWHHVAATFDGAVARLYVDGELEAETREQSGEVLYDLGTSLVLGCYRDTDEQHSLDGRLLSARLEPVVWSNKDVQRAYSQRSSLTDLPAWTDMEFEFLVPPYLTWPTTERMSVLFETSFPSAAIVRYRADFETPEQARTFESSAVSALHECRLEDLLPDQKYFYQVSASLPDRADNSEDPRVESEWLSFRTAASTDKAFTFVVIGDTQTNGEVAKRVSDLAWMHRPNLAVHAGDLVDTGSNKRDWTDVFFPSMQPLLGRVPLMPVLGNHEQDAEHYYRYMSLPEPERWYSFVYGNAEFFMIDGNRSLADQSAQLKWLKGALSSSKATWRFAVLHQPPYTSDADDYGDTWMETSYRGDENVRNIVHLLERYDVDICFSGHVHDYERTFPIRESQVTAYEDGGVIYVTAAGGGGHLEDFDPTNTWFGHKKARYHHLVYVAIHGEHLEYQAIDEEGRLFDTLVLKKRK